MPKAFDRCVRKTRGKVRNPYATCRASMGTDAQIAARRKRKKKASRRRT